MNLEQALLIAAIVSTALPVIAALLRGRTRPLAIVATLLAAAAVSAQLAIVLRLVQLGPRSTPGPWVYALAASAVPVLLGAYVFSICFGRDRPEGAFRESRRTLGYLVIFGVVFLFLLRHSALVTGYNWDDGRGTIHLGFMGKAFVSYLLIGIVLVGHNLEKAYRISAVEVRYRLRPVLFGLFGVLAFYTFLLATGLLYSSIGLGKFVAAGLLVMLASAVVAHGYLRGAIADVSAPVSRSIVYSSFTALAAGLLVLSLGIAAQVATLTKWSPDEILIVGSGLLAVLIGLLLLISNRFQRTVRRYIDRNFYVNRYDYRTQWSKVTESLENVTDEEHLLQRVASILRDIFVTDGMTIALAEEAARRLRPAHGKGAGSGELLEPDTPLFQQLEAGRKSMLLDRNPNDLTYIPIYAENRAWLDATASQIVGPLTSAGALSGTIGLERRDAGDKFTYEDVALLDSICAHVSAALVALRLGRQLADARESELMSQWSSMVLHDLKNYLAPLRMAASNLIEQKDDPAAAVQCAHDVAAVAERMEKLVLALSQLRANPRPGAGVVEPNALVRETVTSMQLARRASLRVDMRLEANRVVRGDAAMLRRVVENLVGNAVDAMEGAGTLSIQTRDYSVNGHAQVLIGVADTGPGMTEEFIRKMLFRPFATTKKKGLGLGLYQSRAIVQAHGGELSARSVPGKGSVFEVALAAIATPEPGAPGRAPVAAASEGKAP
jgi:hypothetical protein